MTPVVLTRTLVGRAMNAPKSRIVHNVCTDFALKQFIYRTTNLRWNWIFSTLLLLSS